jgi:hypothetical protein
LLGVRERPVVADHAAEQNDALLTEALWKDVLAAREAAVVAAAEDAALGWSAPTIHPKIAA